jgi:serine protease Do
LGFYDDPPDFQQPRRRLSIFLVAVISAVIGGLLVLLLAPLLYQSGVMPLSLQTTEPPLHLNNGPVQTTSVKVNSQITDAVTKVQPAVVGILNFGRSVDLSNPEKVQQGTGSGIIYERGNGKARVITNNHVIQNSSEVRVVITTSDDKSKTIPAKILGKDEITDLAILEISDQYVTALAVFGNSDTLKAGEPAIAIGNPLGLGQSVTVGVISSPRRAIDVNQYMATDVIQTDAAINPGNSGGALINVAGQVIGINTLKIAESGVEGLGFAIPANDARPVINDLVRYGRVLRPFLGISYVDLQHLPQGVWKDLQLPAAVEGGIAITGAELGKPAAQAGLKAKDVIVALDEQPIYSGTELRKYLYKQKKIGDSIKVTYYRNGKKETATATLSEAPQNLLQENR